ncbi:MAG TPA: creatininase family protein [Fimbriimonas sp.]|nr:creatininase family protein [Fimbriimonas sp.]
MRKVQWERMFPHELEAEISACPVVYFSYGLCEPHGPHNALGLDALKAHAICCRTAQEHGGIVAPPDYWHIHEVGGYAIWAEREAGENRPWLTAVPPWIHFKNVCYHVRAADALGFHAAILLTGHYGPNWQDLKTVLSILQPHFSMRLYGLPDFEANKPGFDGDGQAGDHAGKVETSLLWAVEPDCVDVSLLPGPSEPGPHFAMGKTARDSDPKVGARMVEDEVRWLGAKAEGLLEEYRQRVEHRLGPKSFIEVEQIWRDEIEPKLPGFESMQSKFWDQPPSPSAGSRWMLNWNPGQGTP